VAVAAAVLVLALFPAPASAAVVCPGSALVDSDNDGLSDAAECAGITLPAALGGGFFAHCTPGVARATCVDPDSKDVFIIVVPAFPTSLLPSNLLQFLSALPVAVHVITATTQVQAQALALADRTVNGTEKAIRLSESLDTNGVAVGQCTWGTPNDAGDCVVFTQRIVNFVKNTYATCQPVADFNTIIQPIITTYIQQVAAHEPSHSIKLTKIYDKNYGGHHYAPGPTMMAQSTSYSCKGGKLTWTIGTSYTTADVGDLLLK